MCLGSMLSNTLLAEFHSVAAALFLGSLVPIPNVLFTVVYVQGLLSLKSGSFGRNLFGSWFKPMDVRIG